MSTSLREQLLKLQTPQSSQFVDSKRRDSILFTSKDAATKSRETIYEIGLSGLRELIEIDDSFSEFEITLFDYTVKDVQRAVETDDVNRLLNKNIKRFIFHLSPYFLIPSSHKCLEWLIRRFNINLYNKEELLMLVLPYHQTNMFVRCVQVMKFDDPSDKWNFLAEVKKTSVPLSKLTLWNHGASQPAFIEFIGKFTYEAIKELNHAAGKLQTMISFYFTSIVGSLEKAPKINDNHIIAVSKYLIKTFKSNVVDYSAAGLMIMAQLMTKANLKDKLLYELMDRLTKTINIKLMKDCIVVLALMFQTQSDGLKITDVTLENLLQMKGIVNVLRQIRSEGKIITDFYKALIYKILIKIQEKDEHFEQYKEFCEILLNEIEIDDEVACIVIRTILDSYVQEDVPNGSTNKMNTNDVITLDSDDESIPLKSQDITIWYSNLLKMLERQHPVAFDVVVKDVMTRNPGRKRNGLKNVLGFLLNVSCSTNDTNIFENLYHQNAHIRSEAVAYLVNNLKTIDKTPENVEILKMTLSERLNDDDPQVVLEVLKMDFDFLLDTVGCDELIARLSKILMKYWTKESKWNVVLKKVLEVMTSSIHTGCSDQNIVLLSVLPFFFTENREIIEIIKTSNFATEQNVLKNLPALPKDISSYSKLLNEYFQKHKNLPSCDAILQTIKKVLIENHQCGSFKPNFAFYLLQHSIKSSIKHDFMLDILSTLKTVYNFTDITYTDLKAHDVNLKSSEMSTNLISKLFESSLKALNFESSFINFAKPTMEMKVLLEIFHFIVDLYYKTPQKYRNEVNSVIIDFLDAICGPNETKKLDFFSQFCIMHASQPENSINNLEFQLRVMTLFHHVLKSNLIDAKKYSDFMHQNVALTLCGKSKKIREVGIGMIEILDVQESVTAAWKFLYKKIVTRKCEILMDGEQIKMIFYLLANKNSAKMQEIKNSMLDTISNEDTFDYTKAELLILLKHFGDKKVLDVAAAVAMRIIDEFDENYYFNENHGAIIKLILMKFSHSSVDNLWELALRALKCHFIMNDEDGKITTPSMLVLQAIDKELYGKLHAKQKLMIFNEIIECYMNEQPRVLQCAQKVFYEIDLDYKMIKECLVKLTRPAVAKKKDDTSNVLFETKEWKFGIALLELLQKRSTNIDGEHELIPILFDILQNCLRSNDSDMEYIKQMILSLLLSICKEISPNGRNRRCPGLNHSTFKTELIIRCIKETQNPQTHHHSLLLLAELSLMIPEQVLRDIMTIFTFVGTTLVRHDDSYSFQIITKIIENIVPNFIKGAQKDEIVPILKTFAAIVLDVPVHRRMMLYEKLLTTFGAENHFWMFIGVLLEIQVVQHQKSTGGQEELPIRLKIALEIAKEFDIKTIVITATSLIVYLRDLPMVIDNSKEKIATRNTENEIFSLKTHTSGQMRHFKYLVSLFVKYTLESPEVFKKAQDMSEEMVFEMRKQFQELILNTLILIPDITKFIEMKQHEKSWQIILQTSFDILEASIALLAPDMFLIVVEKLICHDYLVVRKKVLELLNRKIESGYFKGCEQQKLLKLMVPLKTIYKKIGEKDTKLAEEVVQQSALITIKLLASKLCEDSPDAFIDCLSHLTNVMADNKETVKVQVMINLVDCVAELVAELKINSISLLGKIMPNMVKLLTFEDDNQATLNLLYSATSSLLKIVETVPLFLSPYLVQMVLQLIRVHPVLKLVKEGKISMILMKISKIWEAIAETVPTRILFPIINEIYDKINQKSQYTSIEPLMELLNEIFQRVDSKALKSYQTELTDFFLKALQFRSNVNDLEDLSFKELNDIELFIIRALIGLILKQSEGSFRPLFETMTNWAVKEEANDCNRLITFFRLTSEISLALKSLFLLFASDLVESAGKILDDCNPSKAECDENATEKNLFLIEFILKTLHNMFVNDHQNFINSQRFGVIMQPIVDQMENDDVLENEGMLELMRMSIAQLAVAASDDILWKQLNHQVLLKTRSENPDIRILGIKTCVDIARKLTEDFESLVPETIPFLSELLADEDYRVVQACENAVRELEAVVGESLQKYF